jgi:hypothetical protein
LWGDGGKIQDGDGDVVNLVMGVGEVRDGGGEGGDEEGECEREGLVVMNVVK